MSKFNNFFNSIIEKREGETDEDAYKRQMAGIEKLKQMSQIKKDMNAAGNTQDARLQGLQNLVNVRYGKGSNVPQQQAAAAPTTTPVPVATAAAPVQAPVQQKFDPKKFDDIDNEVGGVAPQPAAAPVINPKQAAPKPNTAVTNQFNNAYTSYVPPQTKTTTSQALPQSPSPQSLPAPQPALPPPAAASSIPASPKKPIDASKITKQYDTMSKIVNDPNAPKGEKDAAQKKMSEFEKKYQEIINKYKTTPTGPTVAAKSTPVTKPTAAPTTATPAAAPIVPTTTTPTASPVIAPVTPTAAPAPAAAATPGGGKIPPPPPGSKPPPPSSGGRGRRGERGGGVGIQPQQSPTSLSGLQQQFRGMGLAPGKQGQQPQQKGPDIISRIAAAPFNALNKGIGAYSKIVNAPRKLGQALKAAAGGEPYPLQQQIAGTAQKAGLTAVKQPEPASQAAAQQYSNQQKINDLIQRIRKNPNDQQALTQLKGMGY